MIGGLIISEDTVRENDVIYTCFNEFLDVESTDFHGVTANSRNNGVQIRISYCDLERGRNFVYRVSEGGRVNVVAMSYCLREVFDPSQLR